jgi:hypothetical protein
MRLFAITMLGLAVASAGTARAGDPGDKPLPVPLTRPELKQSLEDLKARKPRIPLPELTEADREKLGERSDNYEARLRYHYLPGGDTRPGGFSREPDPAASLGSSFKTELFWLVSRANNCHY